MLFQPKEKGPNLGSGFLGEDITDEDISPQTISKSEEETRKKIRFPLFACITLTIVYFILLTLQSLFSIPLVLFMIVIIADIPFVVWCMIITFKSFKH